MKKLRTVCVISAALFLAAGCGRMAQQEPTNVQENYTEKLSVGPNELRVQVVRTRDDMRKGLSGREPLREDEGMLFDYGPEAEERPAFWMPDMKFDIDIIWIKDEKIVGITRNVPAPRSKADPLPYYYPPSPVDQTLEVLSGWSERHKVKVGDAVRLK